MNILFIEDDPMNRRVVNDMLEVAGASMTGAERAGESLAQIDAGDFDVILLDLRMPGMDGFEALRRIRTRSNHKAATPVVIVTADTADGLRDRCLAAGADGFLCKPVAIQALFDGIAHVLARPAGRPSEPPRGCDGPGNADRFPRRLLDIGGWMPSRVACEDEPARIAPIRGAVDDVAEEVGQCSGRVCRRCAANDAVAFGGNGLQSHCGGGSGEERRDVVRIAP